MLQAHKAELARRRREIIEEIAVLLEEKGIHGLERVERIPGGLVIRTFTDAQVDLRVLFGVE